jgi:opacity protein-like surface antigen
MKFITYAIAAACLFASVSTASARPVRPGPYLTGFLGVSMPNDSGIFTATSSGFADETIGFDAGINTGAALGYDFGYMRMEGELSYKHNSLSSISDNSNPANSYRNIDGSVSVLATMFNAFFTLRNDSPITPYIGGGLGAATVYISDSYASINGAPRDLVYSKDNDTVFAYQFGTGVEIALRPRYSLDIGYRYFATDKTSFTNGLFYSNGLKVENHNVSVGLRVRF